MSNSLHNNSEAQTTVNMAWQKRSYGYQRETCNFCGEEVCIFVQFEADVMGLRRWHAHAAAIQTNREKWKFAFRTYFRWSKGIGGEREKLQRCVEIGVRTWFPSCAYMGFYDDDDITARR